MSLVRRHTSIISAIALLCGAALVWLYAAQFDDEHESFITDQVEVVKAARQLNAGDPLTKDRITTEKVPRKFLPPNPLLESELNIYLGTPLADPVEEGAMLLSSDFVHELQQVEAHPDDGPAAHGPSNRLIIKTASLGLASEAPKDVASKLFAMTERVGGYVVSSGSHGLGDAARVKMTVRVPARAFEGTLVSFRAQGEVVSEELEGRDVTDKFVDVGAQANSQREVERMLVDALSKTTDIDKMLELQDRIAKARLEAEKLEGKVTALKKQQALSTIHVTVHAPLSQPVVAEERSIWHPLGVAAEDALTRTIDMTAFLLRLFGSALPPLTLFAPFGALAIWIRRQRR